jgi:hypothetical protein
MSSTNVVTHTDITESTVNISYTFRYQRVLVSFINGQEKKTTDDISYKFSEAEQLDQSTYWCSVNPNRCQRRKLFIPKSRYTAGG